MPDTKSLRDLFDEMVESKRKHIERLIKLKDAGVTVGAPTLEDIIDREVKAMDNLRGAIEKLDRAHS